MRLHDEFNSLAEVLRRHPQLQPQTKQPAPTTIKGRAALINMLVGIITKSLPDAPGEVMEWIQELINQDYAVQARPARVKEDETEEEAGVRKFNDRKAREKADKRKEKLEIALKGLKELKAESAYNLELKRISESKRSMTEAWKDEEHMIWQSKQKEAGH